MSAEGLARRRPDLRLAIRQPQNWWQLGRFLLVGVSGYTVNLLTFALLVHAAGTPYLLAGIVANLVALANNFVWHRHWTFVARHRAVHHQALRFAVVSAGAFVIALGMLRVFVEVAGLPEVLAQAGAVACTAPFNFAFNKVWSFRH
jgi:putative flippase GtrA